MGGEGSVWGETINHCMFWSRGRHVGSGGGGCAGGQEGMRYRWVWWGRCCGVAGNYKPLNSLCFGAEEGMWAVGSGECGGGECGGA